MDLTPIDRASADLSPMELAELSYDGGRLIISPPLVVDVALELELDGETDDELEDAEPTHYMAVVSEYRLFPIGRTRDDLRRDLEDWLRFMWRYAASLGPDDGASAGLRAIQRAMLDRVRFVAD